MTQYKISISDFRAHMSAYLKDLQMGHTIIVTSHGKPIAQILPTKADLMERVKALQDAGLIEWSGKKPSAHTPAARNTSGKLMSDLVVELRK